MRLVLVGAPADRVRLRAKLGPDAEVVAEVETIAAARPLSAGVDAWLVAPARLPDEGDQSLELDPLTPRELEVLKLLAAGLSNKAIASALRISDQTVKFHVAAICGKLSAANRTDVVRRAIRLGLVPL